MSRPTFPFRTIAVAAVIAILTSAAAAIAGNGPRETGAKEEADESEAIRLRARDYVLRHGDSGAIDPERRLHLVREELENRLRDQAGPRPAAIGGTNWVNLGPTNGAGRMTALAVHPTQAQTLYAGAADGGLWKSADGGAHWTPLTDNIADLSVGALAIAKSSPQVIYLGTGEGGIASDFIPGIGLLKSTDGGATWLLPSSVVATEFYRLSVHPSNPNELLAGTNRGGLRSTDGGAHFSAVIDPAKYGDVADLVRDPTNASILYSTTWDEEHWCALIHGCTLLSPRVLKSTDSGATWAEKSQGIPISTATLRVQRLSIAITPSNPSILYAAGSQFDTTSGSEVSHVFKSTDGGGSWIDLPGVSQSSNLFVSQYLFGQGWYDNVIAVNPSHPNVVVAGGVDYIRSTDSGATWNWFDSEFGDTLNFQNVVHADAHDFLYVGSTLYIANDGGVFVSSDDGLSAANRNATLVTRQFYALALDPTDRTQIFAGSQDNGTGRRSPSNDNTWDAVLGADGFFCTVNALAPSIAYGTTQGSRVFRTKEASAAGVPYEHPAFAYLGPTYPPGELTAFRTLVLSDPNDPARIFVATHRLWESKNGGDSWRPLPTATTDGSEYRTTHIFAASISPQNSNVMMIAKAYDGNDFQGEIFRSNNGGQSWTKASGGLPDALFDAVEIDPRNPLVSYAGTGGTTGNRLFKTTDGGRSWKYADLGLPPFAVHVIRIDPTDSSVVFAGTDVGVFRSVDGATTWSRFGTGLPASSIQDLRISADAALLRVATHGRGVWELQIPSSADHAPSIALTSAAGPLTTAKGTTLSFSATASDPDAGDVVEVVWTFPDTWDSIERPGGPQAVAHRFERAGVFPVSIVATDLHGTATAKSVRVSVPETFDTCSTPYVVPGNVSSPVTILVNDEAGSSQPSDPIPPCGGISLASYWTDTQWIEFTPATSGTYEFSDCGGGVDTVLSLWTGAKCGPYVPVASGCNDNAPPGSPCFGLINSDLSVALAAGQTVRLLVDTNQFDARGQFPLTIRSITAPGDSPLPTGVAPYRASPSGGTLLVVFGSNFQSDATVTVGGKLATNVSVVEGLSLTAIVPPGPAGPADIVVTNPGGHRGTLVNAFVYSTDAPGRTAVAAKPNGPGRVKGR